MQLSEKGCGKFILLRVLLGEIKGLFRRSFDKWKKENINLFEYISYINQNTFLLNDTLKCNIDMENKLSESEVNRLILLMKLENMDPNYIVEDNGRNLSGRTKTKNCNSKSDCKK